MSLHLGFPITETQLHILKSAWPKLKVESWFKVARKVFVKRLFWFLNNTRRDWMPCVRRLPQENVLFSNLIFIILPFSAPCLRSEVGIHYANTLHISEVFSPLGLQVFFLSQARWSPTCPDIVLPHVVEMTSNKHPWDDGMWSPTRVCTMSAPPPPFALLLAVISMQTAFTRHQSGHYERGGNGRLFVWVVFLVWYRILGIRLHIRSDHNCLLLTGELLVFHLKSASFTFHH